MSFILIALGANVAGPWGSPPNTLARAARALPAGLTIVRASALYKTEAVGTTRQPPYLNAVILATSRIPPAVLLRAFKAIERDAGRRPGPVAGARPLDLDIIDYGGRRIGWPPGRRVRGGLVLPHPLAHLRAFVLTPLLDVAPKWTHPVLRIGGHALLARLPHARHGVRRILDSRWLSCDEGTT